MGYDLVQKVLDFMGLWKGLASGISTLPPAYGTRVELIAALEPSEQLPT